MMPKQLPSVADDLGYQEEARRYATHLMTCKGGLMLPPKSMYDISEWIDKALQKAYLSGAQSAIRIGYRLAEKDFNEAIGYYKRQIAELEKRDNIHDNPELLKTE